MSFGDVAKEILGAVWQAYKEAKINSDPHAMYIAQIEALRDSLRNMSDAIKQLEKNIKENTDLTEDERRKMKNALSEMESDYEKQCNEYRELKEEYSEYMQNRKKSNLDC